MAVKRLDWIAVCAAAWGFAEATVFFIVPDVLLTTAMMWSEQPQTRRILAWVLAAVCGAVLGGGLMRYWATADPADATRVVLAVPGISEPMRAGVERELDEHGAKALLTAGWRGLPYKLFAVEAGRAGIGEPQFTIASIGARTARFSGTLVVAWLLRAWLFRSASRRKRVGSALLTWALIYTAYVLTLIA